MEITTETEKVVRVQKLVAIVCDVCGHRIEPGQGAHGVNHCTRYYDVETGHHSWGNDSADSIAGHHVCSIDCLVTHLQRYFSNPDGYSTADYRVETAYI